MRKLLRIAAGLSFAIIVFAEPSALIAEDHFPINDLKTAELELAAADAAWLAGNAAKAVPRYESLLTELPNEAEPFRATIIMRLARAGGTSICCSMSAMVTTGGRIFYIIVKGVIGLGNSSVQTSSGTCWPGWLGPERNGWVEDFQPPAQWPDELKKGWQVEVGTGYSSPLVANGLVYQHARQGNDEAVYCFELKTGKLKWRQNYAVPFKASPGGERHGAGPKSSPALADGRLFTMSIMGDLTAWDAESGKRLWRTDYGSQFKPNRPNWGVATSPIVDGERVIAHFGNDDNGALVALGVESGAEVWSRGSDGPSYSSPLVVEIHGVRQVVEWNHRALVGVASESGRFLWEFPFPHIGPDQNMPTPVFHRGRVLLGGENRGIHCLEPQVSDGTWSVKERWHQEKVALNMSTAVVNGELLFGFSHYDKGQFFCLDIESGKVLWQGPGRTGDNVMFLSVPGYIVALINDGRLQIIAARGDRFEQVASYRVAEKDTYAPPVLLPNGFLVKDLKTLTFWSLTRPAASLR